LPANRPQLGLDHQASAGGRAAAALAPMTFVVPEQPERHAATPREIAVEQLLLML
jgi:hypothetical protein